MLQGIRKIEKKWIQNFLSSSLVEGETLQKDLTHQIFYGLKEENKDADFPAGFKQLYEQRSSFESLHVLLNRVQDFLLYAGITLREERVLSHLEKFPDDAEKVWRNCFYFFKTLAHLGDGFDPKRPFRDCSSNVYFLLRIESGESVMAQQLEIFEELELPELYSKFKVFPKGYESNEVVLDLFTRLESTNDSFFITGKAGTGKSTFIQYFARHTKKKVLMLAFTGIAAINVGGQTIHSFFLFPLKPMIPEDDEIHRFPPTSEKYKIISQTHTIIIDEVSMLRSDILEAIDFSLRINGGDPSKRFGGKQMLFIGDIFQLPPVVNMSDETERILFEEEYRSEYFFDSPAYKEINPGFFEFQKSYRQKEDLEFVNLLDAVRVCEANEEVLTQLNQRYFPNYIAPPDAFVMKLCAHNWVAEAENKKKLLELPHREMTFEAKITGEFRVDRYPTNPQLTLKKDAQVILVKNDSAFRWVNGTIAKIDFLSHDLLEIRLQDGSIHKLEPVMWENRKYKYDRMQRRVVSELIGTFTQFPIKLAWAITIHKSQGLTFDNVDIDLGNGAFVNGQVYTALSRCRKLEGITLRRKLQQKDIITDQRILGFYQAEQIEKHLLNIEKSN